MPKGNLGHFVGPCYTCGGPHWARDYPQTISNTKVSNLPIFCLGCGFKHLITSYPNKPREDMDGRKVTLNYISTISSPFSLETDANPIGVRVVTRAQAKKKKKEEQRVVLEERAHKSKRKQKRRTKCRK